MNATEINLTEIITGCPTLADCDAAIRVAVRLRDAGYRAEDQDRIACANALIAAFQAARRSCPLEQKYGHRVLDMSDGPQIMRKRVYDPFIR